MLIDYNSVVIGVILRVNHTRLQKVKNALVAAAQRFETDDRSYVYVPGEYQVLNRRGAFIGKVSNYLPMPLRLDFALKQTVYVLALEEPDTEKHIFVFVDDYKVSEQFGFLKGLNTDIREHIKVNYTIMDFSNNADLKAASAQHPRCQYLFVEDINELSKMIIDTYYPERTEDVLDSEFKEKYGKTPYEAKQERKIAFENLPD